MDVVLCNFSIDPNGKFAIFALPCLSEPGGVSRERTGPQRSWASTRVPVSGNQKDTRFGHGGSFVKWGGT